mmetsp:Transcript_31572/g.98424  ORF Transcript_31572/g.98424 Transcript_31572/m.98424 type:complete len:255 (+) Transcript_31572:179-943(+)
MREGLGCHRRPRRPPACPSALLRLRCTATGRGCLQGRGRGARQARRASRKRGGAGESGGGGRGGGGGGAAHPARARSEQHAGLPRVPGPARPAVQGGSPCVHVPQEQLLHCLRAAADSKLQWNAPCAVWALRVGSRVQERQRAVCIASCGGAVQRRPAVIGVDGIRVRPCLEQHPAERQAAAPRGGMQRSSAPGVTMLQDRRVLCEQQPRLVKLQCAETGAAGWRASGRAALECARLPARKGAGPVLRSPAPPW